MVVPDEIGGFAEFMHQSIRASEMSLQGPSRNSDQNLRRETEHKNTVGFERLPTITDSEGNSERESTLLTKGQVEAFREVFELFDKNGNLAFFMFKPKKLLQFPRKRYRLRPLGYIFSS